MIVQCFIQIGHNWYLLLYGPKHCTARFGPCRRDRSCLIWRKHWTVISRSMAKKNLVKMIIIWQDLLNLAQIEQVDSTRRRDRLYDQFEESFERSSSEMQLQFSGAIIPAQRICSAIFDWKIFLDSFVQHQHYCYLLRQKLKACLFWCLIW